MSISSEIPVTNGFHPPVADAAIERERLELELEAARLRLVDARARAQAREQAQIEALRDAVAASRITLAQLERDHEDALKRLQAATDGEVEQILHDAAQVAASLRSVGGLAQPKVHDAE